MESVFADIILPLPLSADFTYAVPSELQHKVEVGKRVIVQFGKKKFYSGLIRKLHQECPEYDEIKEIESILDDEPVIHREQIEFWEWMSKYYMCSLGEVMKAALPSGLKLESQTKVIFNPEFEAKEKLTDSEEVIFRLLNDQKVATIQDVNSALASKNGLRVIKSLLQKGAISVEEKLKNSYKPKTEVYLQLNEKLQSEASVHKMLNTLTRAKKQHDVLTHFLDKTLETENFNQLIAKKQLVKVASSAAIKALVDKNIFRAKEVRVDRLHRFNGKIRDSFSLNIHQQKAFDQINEKFQNTPTVLLHGVTASGKTEIYIRLIEECLASGKQVLYLLPEIGLTTQIIQRLKNVFGDKAGIYHSKFNDHERVEIWNNVLQNDGESDLNHQIVLGARSAVFLPFKNLGLIIIDEEHENSYKQFDPAPRYHARDAAMVLAHLHGAKTLLGTATPSIDSYFNAVSGKYGLVELTKRHGDIELPEIVVADSKEAYRKKRMRGHFTPELFGEIEQALEKEEQVILFQNRRGFSPFVQCESCGWIPVCTDCDVSLTYHKNRNLLICHYCGHTKYMPPKCGSCGDEQIETKGFGTEKIEEELVELFPDAKVARMDMDSTRTKYAFEKLIDKFEKKEIDILVGTQMITKGLDFANVSTVGILNADNMFNYPDFRSFERSFQLISQVSGRAGRKNKQGKVIVQTSSPDHQVIKDVQDNDYQRMFKSQLQERNMFKYPPFYRMITITLKHRDARHLDRASAQLAHELRQIFGNRILGPEYPVISRLQQWYQKIIWLKVEKKYAPSAVKKSILEKIHELKNKSGNSTLIISADVDPQ